MTFVVALRFSDGVVVVSDSRAVSGVSAEEVKKLKPILRMRDNTEHDLAIVGDAWELRAMVWEWVE